LETWQANSENSGHKTCNKTDIDGRLGEGEGEGVVKLGMTPNEERSMESTTFIKEPSPLIGLQWPTKSPDPSCQQLPNGRSRRFRLGRRVPRPHHPLKNNIQNPKAHLLKNLGSVMLEIS